MEKLHEYQGWSGRFHEWRDNIRNKFTSFREEHPEGLVELAKTSASNQMKGNANAAQDYSHVYR